MKHTLKSLLVTTVLILPTVLGAELPPEVQGHAPKMSIVELVAKAGQLERMGRPKAAARLYAGTVYHPDVLWFNILFATKMITDLGYPEIAIEAYKQSMEQPKTKIFAPNALDAIQRLEHVPSRWVKSTLEHLCPDVRTYMTGFPGGDNLCLGWLSLQDLANLSIVSTEWHQYAQPMVEAAN